MRSLVRFSAVLVLLAAPGFALLRSTIPIFPEPRPSVHLADLEARGEIRVAFRQGTLSYFSHRAEPHGFEYELLESFAGQLGVRLAPRPAPSGQEAEQWLRQGIVDVAVLRPEHTRPPGLLEVPPYVQTPRTGVEYPPTGALYVREESRELRAELTAHLLNEFQRGAGGRTFRRYFAASGTIRRLPPEAAAASRQRLSRYETLIARHAREAGYDWRLIAALIFNESGFDPTAVSSRGAVGLMQVMPATGERVGVSGLNEPDANLRAGLRYLRYLSGLFSESRGEDHLAMVLSAYLLGPGHVQDAQALARDIGLDPRVWWGSIEDVLPLLEDPAFHAKARHGYAQGRHAVQYVYRIFQLHHSLRNPGGALPERLAARARGARSREG